MIRWEVGGPYEAVFSTRLGGVSEDAFASLNLGLLTGDDPALVEENRRRLCAEVGADPTRLALNRQVHGTEVHRARPGMRGAPGDALRTDEPGLPMLTLTADCLPIAVARSNGDMHSVLRGRSLDLPAAAEAALRSAGCASVERLDLCTSCHADLFFSHRRDGERTGRQGVIGIIRSGV